MVNARPMHLPFIFDFDGVLVDSVPEVIGTTYAALQPDAGSPATVPDSFAMLFSKNRWLVQPAGDLLVLGRWCLDNLQAPEALLSRETWLSLLAAAPDTESSRRALFFATRAKRIPQDRLGWLALHKTYEPLWSTLTRLIRAKAAEVLILTNKNRAAVTELASHFGLPLQEHWIFSGDGGVSKQQNLNRIFQEYPWAQHTTFIDDSIYNLQEIQKLSLPHGFKLALASWGYLGAPDRELSKKLGISCMSCEEVSRHCDGHSRG